MKIIGASKKRMDFGIPQLLVNTDAAVTLLVTITSELYGTRHGIATSRRKQGSSAERQSSFETCETSAIGRALSSMGYGLIPGSGLASAEDMSRVIDPESSTHKTASSNGNGQASRSNGSGQSGGSNGNGKASRANGNGQASASAHSSYPISSVQIKKLNALYRDRFPGTDAQITQGLDAVFSIRFSHPMAAATSYEASTIVAQLNKPHRRRRRPHRPGLDRASPRLRRTSRRHRLPR